MPDTIKIELWIPRRSDSRISSISEEVASITDSEPEVIDATNSHVQILTSTNSFDDCSALESWIPSEFPDHEKWIDSSETRFTLRLSPSTPDVNSVLSKDEINRLNS
ncbi:hypothetical protein [Haloarcula sp. H-GB5]